MIRKGLFLVCALLIPALLLAAKPSKSKGKNKKKAKTEQTDTASVKKTSDYDKLFKGKNLELAPSLTAYVVSIPVYFGSAYVMLSPLLNSLQKLTNKK